MYNNLSAKIHKKNDSVKIIRVYLRFFPFLFQISLFLFLQLKIIVFLCISLER